MYHWRLAGKFLDRHHIEAHRDSLTCLSIGNRRAMRPTRCCFSAVTLTSDSAEVILARRPLLYKHQRFSILANQVNLALHFSRHIVPRYKNISMPSQIPIREGLSTDSALPRILFYVT
jgi:hypothetical protein